MARSLHRRIGLRVAAAAMACLLLATATARGEPAARSDSNSNLLGPLRVRDMTPFNLLRLDMLPAHAVSAGPGSWAIEADLSFSNTFVMSDNVREYLQGRAEPSPLTEADAQAILGLGEDAYYVDGEFGLLEVTFHYRVMRRTSVYMTLSAYSFAGGFLDGTIESFHEGFGLGNSGRDLVGRNRLQTVMSLNGTQVSFLDAPVGNGLGDPVLGLRHVFPFGASPWNLVVSAEAKIAWRGERLFLSTGSNDFGVQTSLQGKFRRQAVYLTSSFVSTDGRVLGIELERRVVPTLAAAYELAITEHTNFIGQLHASQSTVRESTIDLIKADKYQASLGLRSRRGPLIYGLAVTENIKNFDNTPDIGVTLTFAWTALRP
jgi:Protein of unknown function (DUF3187)